MAGKLTLDILIRGVVAAWDAASTLSGIDGPYRKAKPADPSDGFPYCIIGATQPSESVGWSSSSEYWNHNIAFDVYHENQELAAGQAQLVANIFDSESLSIALSVGSMVQKRKGLEDYIQEDEDVHRHRLTYRIKTSIPRTP